MKDEELVADLSDEELDRHPAPGCSGQSAEQKLVRHEFGTCDTDSALRVVDEGC